MRVSKIRDVLLVTVALCAAIGVSWQGFAQQLFIYPAKGQNAQQQSRVLSPGSRIVNIDQLPKNHPKTTRQTSDWG